MKTHRTFKPDIYATDREAHSRQYSNAIGVGALLLFVFVLLLQLGIHVGRKLAAKESPCAWESIEP